MLRADALATYTLDDLGVIPESALYSPYQPRINASGTGVEFQAPANLSPFVGNGFDPAGRPQAYILANGSPQWLGPSGPFVSTVANAGSPDLLVGAVSFAGSPTVRYPAVYSPQTGWTGIAANSGEANAINDQGQIVGETAAVIGTGPHAFLFQSTGGYGTLVDLNSLIPSSSNLTLLTATDINDLGQIVGIASERSDPNNFQVFELSPVSSSASAPTPIPEPSTFALFGLITLVLVPFRNRRA
jgi:probable HAF family extracellular repeat protein